MVIKKWILLIFVFLGLTMCNQPEKKEAIKEGPLKGIRIAVDPGHGNSSKYDSFRVGPTGEREEWINLRVAKILVKKLEAAGADVITTRDADQDVSLGGRASLAKQYHSDLFISIHHNGSVNDESLDYPIIYFWGNALENPASVDFAHFLLREMRGGMTFEQPQGGGVFSDFLIYPQGTSVLRNTVNAMPGVIGEGGFFTSQNGEARLKDPKYNAKEAEVYFQAVLRYVDHGIPKIKLISPEGDAFLGQGATLQFQLDDGLDGHGFIENTLRVEQDGQDLAFEWDPDKGILNVVPEIGDKRHISIKVFARNTAGNALHPFQWSFKTENEKQWRVTDNWKEAYDQAEAIYNEQMAEGKQPHPDLLRKAKNLFQLSLENQHCHPLARTAEMRLLEIESILNPPDAGETEGESFKEPTRVEEFYPVEGGWKK